MPGVVMEHNSIGGRGPDLHDQTNGNLSAPLDFDHRGESTGQNHGPSRINGAQHLDLPSNHDKASTGMAPSVAREPPELQHIVQGFFPLSKLVNRSVQQCWNDLADVVMELAEIQVLRQDTSASPMLVSGKIPGNQTPENVRKKLRALEFAQTRRGEFIKLLVLSQWSRQAAGVSRLIDIQNFIRTQHQAFAGALQWMGDMKRDLVRAQVANPDLLTALEVLSKGEIVSMPHLGYKPPNYLTPKATLRKLRKVNRSISVRLALHENVPLPFRTYRVHDGRVTFIVPGEFELDLSIAENDYLSQFFFVDIRFLFGPSPSVPTGRIFSEIDLKVNGILQVSGLPGCFDWLNNYVLTNKINILTKQASDLARSLWITVLRIELIHRTLVLHYWASKSGAKSWLEIGIRRGFRNNNTDGQRWPSLGLRWVRDGLEVDSEHIEFDTENLSVESLLRSVIALHISHILSAAFRGLGEKLLYSKGSLFLRAHLTRTEPTECQLDVQLTASRQLRVAIEPMSGATILAATPNILERVDTDRSTDRPTIDDIVYRVGRLRCAAAIEEVEFQVTMLGFERINPRNVKIDTRRIFPAKVLRFSFFSHHLWERSWLLAAVSSMDGDNWWVVQTRPGDPAAVNHGLGAFSQGISAVCSAQIICSTKLPVWKGDYSALADLGHSLSGLLTIYANARFLEDLQDAKVLPPLEQLKIGSGLEIPDLKIEYDVSKLPHPLKLATPAGFKKKAYVKRTLRLIFNGIDRHRNQAIVVAYGKLSTSFQALSRIVPNSDPSLVFEKTGASFALRLFASPGYPIIVALLENLQKLECALTIYEVLRQKKMHTRSLSLSRIEFAYGPDRNLYARLDIGATQYWPLNEIDPLKVTSKTEPLSHLRLDISFDPSNPHRRIQGPLASSLNSSSTDVGLDSLAELLLFTLPLMRSLDCLVANTVRNEPFKMHITVRNALSFYINYPLQSCRFQLVAHQHQNRPVWVLKDAPSFQTGSGENHIKYKLRESFYNSKGAGWRGLGNGVIAEPDHVGNLLDRFDKCMTSIRADLASKISDNKASHEAAVTNNQTPASEHGADARQKANSRPTQQEARAVAQKADVIMIDD